MIDPNILLQGRGLQMPQAPDPIEQHQRAISLAQLIDSQAFNRMKMQDMQRQQQEHEQLSRALPGLAAGQFNPQSVQAAIQANPAIAQTVLKMADERRKAQAGIAETEAKTRKEDIEGKIKALDSIANVAAGVARRPDPMGLSLLASVSKHYGVELQMPQDPVQIGSYLQSLASAAYAEKDRVVAEETAKHHRKTEENQAGTLAETKRYHSGSLGLQASGQRQAMDIAKMTDQRQRDLNAITKEGQQDQRTQGQTAQVAKLVESQNLPSLVTSVRMVNDTLGKYANSELPGVGRIKNALPAFMMSEEGKTVRSQIQGVANDLLKLYSGGAVTLNEAQRRAVESMSSGGFTEQDLYNAWPMVVERVNSAMSNVRGGFSPEAVDLYQKRGGMKMENITPAKKGAPVAGGVLTPTGNGEFTYGAAR